MNPYESTIEPDEPKPRRRRRRRRRRGLLVDLIVVAVATLVLPVVLTFWAFSAMQAAPRTELSEPIPAQSGDQQTNGPASAD